MGLAQIKSVIISNTVPGPKRVRDTKDSLYIVLLDRDPVANGCKCPISSIGVFVDETTNVAYQYFKVGSGDMDWVDTSSGGGGGGGVSSVNGASGIVSLDTDDIAEGASLYHTNARVDARITAQKDAANGLATLDADSKVQAAQLPDEMQVVSEQLQAETASNVSASLNEIYPINSTGGPVTVQAATAPSVGDKFSVLDSRYSSSTNNITVDFTTSGQKIFGVTDDFVLNDDGAFVTFVYISAAIGWVVEK